MIDQEEHEAIVALYEASGTTKFGRAVFDLVGRRLPHELLFIALLPIKFELPSLFSKPKYREVCERYVKESNKYDIWLRRSPIGPTVKWVRHSDYTPASVLMRSAFFKEVMRPLNSTHGASLVGWLEGTWLATLTVFRSAEQGDFSDEEMERLRGWQCHFEAGARRLAIAKEERLDDDSLSTFIWDLPTPALILDWDLNPKHFNAAAAEHCRIWQKGLSALARKTSHRKIMVPREIMAMIPPLKPRIEAAKLARPGPLKAIEFETLNHPTVLGLSAKVFFIPSKALSLSRGRFLIQFHHHRENRGTSEAISSLSMLSRTEREVAVQAAQGLSNSQIGRELRKSPGTVKVQLSQIFKKLKLRSRVELASVLAKANNPRSTPLPLGNDPV